MFKEDQLAVRARTKELFLRFKNELRPEVGGPLGTLTEAVYAGGALDTKTKRLMALAVALTHGCRGCILAQLEYALAAGASAQEVLEACSVAISMGGTMSCAETTRVVEYLEQAGKI
ncbi:carboxymuconolactone decarboxylase family protein [Desulfocurvus sp. DL9XJH121]